MGEQTTNVDARDLQTLASGTQQAFDEGRVPGDDIRPVLSALRQYELARQSLPENDQEWSGDEVVSIPTLALRWLRYASNLAGRPVPIRPRTLGDLVGSLYFRIIGDNGGFYAAPEADACGLRGAAAEQFWLIREIWDRVEAMERPTEFVQLAGKHPTATVGSVRVDSGEILMVDPCHLPGDVAVELTSPNEDGVAVATLGETGPGTFRADIFLVPANARTDIPDGEHPEEHTERPTDGDVMKMVDRWKADPPKFTVVKKDKHKYQAYLDRKSRKRVKDLPVEEQKARFKALTGRDPTDAELEMALDLNLL